MKTKNLLFTTLLTCSLAFFSFSASAQYTKLLDFNNTNGKFPYGSLLSDGTYLYGMTRYGGPGGNSGNGMIFRIKPDGTSFSDLFDFNITNG